MKPGNENKLKRRLGPGAWIDENDDLHFSIPELLEAFGEPDTPETRAEMQRICRQVLAENSPTSKIIYRK
jgi:hypothetical protein